MAGLKGICHVSVSGSTHCTGNSRLVCQRSVLRAFIAKLWTYHASDIRCHCSSDVGDWNDVVQSVQWRLLTVWPSVQLFYSCFLASFVFHL